MRFNRIETLAGGLLGFVYPSLLHGFENALATTLRVVIKLGQIEDELAQLGEADGFRVDFGMAVEEFFGNALGVGPFHDEAT